MRSIGYGAYSFNFGAACDPSRASTCDMEGTCYDEQGCPTGTVPALAAPREEPPSKAPAKASSGYNQPAYKAPAFDLVSEIAKFNYNIGPAVESSTPGVAAQAAGSGLGMLFAIILGSMALLGGLGVLAWSTAKKAQKRKNRKSKR